MKPADDEGLNRITALTKLTHQAAAEFSRTYFI